MEVVLIVLILVLVGYFSKIFEILKEEHAKILNNIVIHIAMPSTIFLTILKNVSSSHILEFLKLPMVIFYVVYLLEYWLIYLESMFLN